MSKFFSRFKKKKDDTSKEVEEIDEVEKVEEVEETDDEQVEDVKEKKKFLGIFSRKSKKEKDTTEKDEVVDEEDEDSDNNQSKALATGEKSVIGGWFGDRDSRTRQSANQMFVSMFAFILLIAGTIGLFVQNGQYNHYMDTNTTPFGTTLSFYPSDIPIELKEVWRDNNGMIVVQIGYNDLAREQLSASGENYGLNLLVSRESHKPENFDMSYAMLGTDGDGYLIMNGDFDNRAYQVVLENYSKLATSDIVDGDLKSFIDENQSITNTLAEHSQQDIGDDGQISFDNEQEDLVDIASFRVNPYSESTRIYDGSFTNEDGTVDYDTIVRATSINDIINNSKLNVKQALENIEIFENQKSEYIARLEENKDDRSARSQLPEVDRNIEAQEEIIEGNIRQIRFLEQFEFSEDDFGAKQSDFKMLVF